MTDTTALRTPLLCEEILLKGNSNRQLEEIPFSPIGAAKTGYPKHPRMVFLVRIGRAGTGG